MNHRVTSKDAILEKAMDIALAQGVDKVSIRKIATACEISIGSVYNYYKDKETLITDIAEGFWQEIFKDQEQLYREGMNFTLFLEQYYILLYGRLSPYDKSWLREMEGRIPEKTAIPIMRKVLDGDYRINGSIWNMELNEDAFCEYVFINIMALLRAGENNCRFFIFLLEHLLYDE